MSSVKFYRLWDLMNRKGLKIKDLDGILSRTTIAHLRKNKCVTTDTLLKICDFLDCEFQDICEIEREKTDEKNAK
jgi:DNA-binding Xre family transcriptional regulator